MMFTEIDMNPKTLCQQMRLSAQITMVIWPGKWTANCDAQGAFMPQQCDMSGKFISYLYHCYFVANIISRKILHHEFVSSKLQL